MVAELATHPSADLLREFALGKLDDILAAVVMNHLDGCPDCCRAAAAQSGDDFLDRLRQAHSLSGTPAPVESTACAAPAPKRATGPTAELPPELANNPHYEVLRELGRGGMGVVYLARNKLMDRLEVLKVVKQALLDRPGAEERFLREIRSAARLNHPNVVTAYSAVQSGQLLAFAMEYVEGEDLAKLVQRQGPLPVVQACDYIQQAALGLQHAFEKKMVHRDIKPQNLLLSSDGKKQIVKVLDFGLAKVMRANDKDPGFTGDGAMLGTPDYVAPEQTLDAANADIRADVYSLGCTLYYLLTGAPPFKGRCLYDVLQAHQSMEARPLHLVRPEVPEELAAVVQKMLAKDPAMRHQTPQALVEALAAFVEPGALERRPLRDVLHRAERDAGGKPPRRKWLIGGGIAVAVLLIGLLGLWAGGVIRVKTPEGTLVVQVNVPNPDVLVDGKKVIVTWDEGGKRAEIRIPAGTREVEVTKDGFAAYGKKVALSEGGSRVLEAWLEPKPRDPSGARPSSGGRPKAVEGSRAGEERDDNALKMKFCWCPTGTIPGFWMGKYEVTQSEWARLMGSMPAHALDKGKGDRHPIYQVSHIEAMEFCRKLTDGERKSGRLPRGWSYRLPTDVQWEYACRAGTTTATAFGDKLASTQANFNGDWPHNGAPKGPNRQKAVEVGSYRPNAWGIYDMHGNVGEFTATPGRHRGGSWCDNGRNCCSEIFIPDPPKASEHVGFRVARVKN
jgi:tRNA A-37 threonylcarbamoyl transferase component Bud32